MKRPKPPTYLALSIVSLALAAACSGSAGSPLGPTGESSGLRDQTTIRGRTSTNSAPSSIRSTAAVSPSTIRVCVTSTAVCTDVDASGHFEISGNFSGDVHLTFTGSQGNANVTIPDVQPGETVVVVVQLLGTTGTVSVESRQGGNDSATADDDSADDVSDDSDDPSEDDESDDESEDDESEDDESEDDESEDDESEDDESEDDDSGPTGAGNRGRR